MPFARDQPLRVLYVGPLTQRTGLSYAFAACRALGSSATLTLVSPVQEHLPRVLAAELAGCHWISDTSASAVQHAMDSHDVFLFPALYDAGTPVLQHALASGLPIIATPHSAAPDLVIDGVDGFIVPLRSSESIAARLELLRQQPERRHEMAREARRRSLVASWGRFENTVAVTVAAALGRRT
jgi:glycosyltransferase involved in cell wall biosynthesis